MRLPIPNRLRDRPRSRSRGQSLVEFALVAPLLLLVFAGAADLGRAFYAYVAIENAAKEGALFGARSPICDDAAGGACADPNNVLWRVRAELREQGVRNPNGTELTPTVACLTTAGVPRLDLRDCASGDTYEVELAYDFRLLTPILGSIVGDLNLRTASRAVVLNLAFDPTPGASVNKFVSPVGAVNASEIVAKCLEPDDTDAAGYYRSPCLDSTTPDPADTVALRFEQGATISYRLRVANIGAQTLTAVTVVDSRGATGCSFPGTMNVGYSQVCDYTRTAPTVTGAANSMDYDNTATISSSQTGPSTDGVRVIVERPPARLRVLKWVSPFELGSDGDGQPGFGTVDDLTVTYRPAPEVASGTAWFKIIVRNTGGQTATELSIIDSHGPLPTNAACPARPATLGAGAQWECRYPVPFSAASPATTTNTVSVTATNVTPDGDDSHTATLRVEACTGSNRTVPRLIGSRFDNARLAWTAAGFSSALDPSSGSNGQTVAVQTIPAYSCIPPTSSMTVSQNATP